MSDAPATHHPLSVMFHSRSLPALLLASVFGILGACQKADPDQKEFEQYVKAAEAGDPAAQRHVGSMYVRRALESYKGYPSIDYEKGARFLRVAAESGHANAQFKLGELLLTGGLGYAPETVDPDSQRMHALLYGGNEPIKAFPSEPKEAVKWLLRSALQGNREAMQKLIGVYEFTSSGETQDLAEAYKWTVLSEAPQDEFEKLDILEITPEQKSEGRRLAAAFKPVPQTQRSIRM
ncbi:MAG: sel1 repeat family protein [Verrucomicrobiales bacterium]|nr:sel1 repeat family protein [Verrucomicrobiales bacterium]